MLQNQMKSRRQSCSTRAPSASVGAFFAFQERTQAVPAALRLFASIFQREVDLRLLEHIEANSRELSIALDIAPLSGLDLDDKEAATETLAVEYCRVFIGPSGHMPPVESIALGEGRFWGPSTQKVADFYEAMGMAVDRDSRMVPDHISMELDCLAMLEERQQSKEASTFAREHLLRWLPGLIDHVEKRATLAFYPTWVKALCEMLNELHGGNVSNDRC